MPPPAQAPAAGPERPDDARWRAVSSVHGVAALRHTHWLDATPRAYERAPGVWRSAAGRVVGMGLSEGATDAPADAVSLAPGEHVDVGEVRLKAIDRDGALALRVFDPEAPGRTRLRGILSFPRSEAWVRPAVFRPAIDGETLVVTSVDGYEREEPAVGTVALEVGGVPVRLTVTGDPADGLSAVIADGTSGVDAYRFRFLPIDVPAPDGSVAVDFNRAYLPPCAFSDQYVCPLPPAGNRLDVRVEAGERLADLA